ncbi:hypothetical protein [Halobellus litoreus]|uniref:Uncharacterized protein n=1 Tax=Halobellus litoreus TaxID=755310 RepID=A0ABD6E116_9EURY|nr:hypothetical protein [Halobellus litoreus]
MAGKVAGTYGPVGEALVLHKSFENALVDWRRVTSKPKGKLTLWSWIDNLRETSQNEEWGKDDDLPSHQDLKDVLDPRYKRYSSVVERRREKLERSTDRLVTHLESPSFRQAFWRTKSPQQSTTLPPGMEQKAAELIEGLSGTKVGLDFIRRQFSDETPVFPPNVLLEQFPGHQIDPSKSLDEQVSEFRQHLSEYEKLSTFAMNMFPGIVQFLRTKHTTEEVKKANQFWRTLISKFVDPTKLQQTSGAGEASKLAQSFEDQMVAIGEEIVKDEESKIGKSTKPDAERLMTGRNAVIANTVIAAAIRIPRAILQFDKVLGDPTLQNVFEFTKIFAEVIDDGLRLYDRLADIVAKDAKHNLKRLRKTFRSFLGKTLAVFSVVDMCLDLKRAQSALRYGDKSVATGAFLAAGGQGLLLLSTVAYTSVLGPVGLLVLAVGTLLIIFSADSPIERWLQNSYFGTEWFDPIEALQGGSVDALLKTAAKYEDPSEMAFKWGEFRDPKKDLRLWRPNFPRQLSAWFSMQRGFKLDEPDLKYESGEFKTKLEVSELKSTRSHTQINVRPWVTVPVEKFLPGLSQYWSIFPLRHLLQKAKGNTKVSGLAPVTHRFRVPDLSKSWNEFKTVYPKISGKAENGAEFEFQFKCPGSKGRDEQEVTSFWGTLESADCEDVFGVSRQELTAPGQQGWVEVELLQPDLFPDVAGGAIESETHRSPFVVRGRAKIDEDL